MTFRRTRRDLTVGAVISEPAVGIFWFVPANIFNMSALVADMTPLAEATDDGGLKIHDRGHPEFWASLASLGAKNLRRQGLPLSIASARYNTHPRGRTEYDPRRQQFTIHADRRIHDWAYMQYVVAFFGLPGESYTIVTDPGYISSQRLGPPKPWY